MQYVCKALQRGFMNYLDTDLFIFHFFLNLELDFLMRFTLMPKSRVATSIHLQSALLFCSWYLTADQCTNRKDLKSPDCLIVSRFPAPSVVFSGYK